ncbi:hypothetical protein GCM10023086_74500 [Streptomyces venetus]|uniref:Ricin B lectin domain-containing protein n=1 Tax=Streptomyces venetus TaxID=1701086 RepID=A0ABP8HHQ4_9ACTN
MPSDRRPEGYVCFWTGPNYTGVMSVYSNPVNHNSCDAIKPAARTVFNNDDQSWDFYPDTNCRVYASTLAPGESNEYKQVNTWMQHVPGGLQRAAGGPQRAARPRGVGRPITTRSRLVVRNAPSPAGRLSHLEGDRAVGELVTRTAEIAYSTLSSTVKIMQRTGASSCRSAASAPAACPSGEANAACSSSIESHSSSATS